MTLLNNGLCYRQPAAKRGKYATPHRACKASKAAGWRWQ